MGKPQEKGFVRKFSRRSTLRGQISPGEDLQIVYRKVVYHQPSR